MESRKMVLMNLFVAQQWRCRCREQTYGQGWGEGGEGEMKGERSMEAYTLPYVKWISSVHSLSRVWLFAAPWTIACQDPRSGGFPRQKYKSRLPSVSPEDLLDPGIEPAFPPLCSQVCYLCLRLHCCPANRFISTIFLDSIYMSL